VLSSTWQYAGHVSEVENAGDYFCFEVACPYHSWTYSLSGQLKSAPNMRAVPGFDASKICLTEVRCEEFCGFIFVNLNPSAEPMYIRQPESVRGTHGHLVPGRS